MKTSKNTILITGGGSGIGLEIARLFSTDNNIIVTGRTLDKLQKAVSELQNVTAIVADINSAADVENLVSELEKIIPN